MNQVVHEEDSPRVHEVIDRTKLIITPLSLYLSLLSLKRKISGKLDRNHRSHKFLKEREGMERNLLSIF